jgi:hypothetical protein
MRFNSLKWLSAPFGAAYTLPKVFLLPAWLKYRIERGDFAGPP